MKSRMEVSAGGVIYRRQKGEAEVCLIQTQGGKAWQLPKGLIERGEEAEEAAVREVAEETGLQGELVQPLERIEYFYVWERTRIHKLVHFFLFRYISGSTENHDDEVDDARWFPVSQAQGQLTFDNEKHVMGLAAKAIGERDD